MDFPETTWRPHSGGPAVPARTALRAAVAVPARDEADLLPRLIRALGRQRGVAHPLDVVIVLNNTTDGSRAAIAAAAAEAPGARILVEEITYPDSAAHVGSARRRAMELARGLVPDGVVLTTDADAVPDPDWVAANLRAIAAGADLVGGAIAGDPEEEARLGAGFLRRARLHARYAALRDALAATLDPLDYDPWPRHCDHTGASLAIRARVLAALGGLDPLPFREDLALVSKARAAGYRLVHPLDVRVVVSARTRGRAPGGMADCLRGWLGEEARGAPVLVEHPDRIERRLRLRRAIRERSWRPAKDEAWLGVEALIERHAADDPDAPRAVPAEQAIAALEARLAAARGHPHAA